jgi:hypothetical protein
VASLPPPIIAQAMVDANGSFRVSGSGPTGQTYRILATTNLMLPLGSWGAVSTGTFSGGVFLFTDLERTNFDSRFYRLITP